MHAKKIFMQISIAKFVFEREAKLKAQNKNRNNQFFFLAFPVTRWGGVWGGGWCWGGGSVVWRGWGWVVWGVRQFFFGGGAMVLPNA